MDRRVEQRDGARQHHAPPPALAPEQQRVEHHQRADRHHREAEHEGVEVRDLRVDHDHVDQRRRERRREVRRRGRHRADAAAQEPRGRQVRRPRHRREDEEHGERDHLVVAQPGGEERVADAELVAVGQLAVLAPGLVEQLARGVEVGDELVAHQHPFAAHDRRDRQQHAAEHDEGGDQVDQPDHRRDAVVRAQPAPGASDQPATVVGHPRRSGRSSHVRTSEK